MVYITTIDAVNLAGLGTRVIDENVGTGDNVEADFDLDNDNVIASSFVISHAPSASNTFTVLTETTDYSLDKESGRIVLTAGGITAVGTDIIFATYTHGEFSDALISEWIDRADDEVDLLTGRKWDSPVSVSEFIDGRRDKNYPTTDEPFIRDFDRPQSIVLTNHPVTEINNVFFLKRGASLDQVWSEDNSASSFTDNTEEANSVGGTDFFLLATSPASNDALYVGSTHKFLGLTTVLGIVGAGSPTITWEFWDGSAWTSFTPTALTSNSDIFTASGRLTWSALSSWTKVAVNASQELFFVRARLSAGSYTTSPKGTSITMDQDGVIDTEVNLRDIDFTSFGKITFLTDSIPNGTRNLRFDYKYGSVTTPSYISELSGLIFALRAYVNLSGGSFDDATGYTIGSKSLQIGEAWVNIKNVITEFRKRKEDILKVIGDRNFLVVV